MKTNFSLTHTLTSLAIIFTLSLSLTIGTRAAHAYAHEPTNPGTQLSDESAEVMDNQLIGGDEATLDQDSMFESATQEFEAMGTEPTDTEFDQLDSVAGSAEIARHGVPAASYQAMFNQFTAGGYRLVWFDGFDMNGNTYFNVLFRPSNGVAWYARHNLTSAQYQAEFDNRPAGFRPLQVESYLSNGAIRYAVIFVQQAGPTWIARHGETVAQHQNTFDSLAQQGYREVNSSVVSVGGVRYYTTLYDKANVGGWVALSAILEAQYQATFNAQMNAGRRLQYLNGYVHNGQVFLSAIWDSTSYGNWVARHDLSSPQYQGQWETWTGAGYLTHFVTGYNSGGTAMFAAVWAH